MDEPHLSSAEGLDSDEDPKNSEMSRIATYKHLIDRISKYPYISMARNGLYFKRMNDSNIPELKCFRCKVSFLLGSDSDCNPIEEHRKLSPKCAVFDPGGSESPGKIHENTPYQYDKTGNKQETKEELLEFSKKDNTNDDLKAGDYFVTKTETVFGLSDSSKPHSHGLQGGARYAADHVEDDRTNHEYSIRSPGYSVGLSESAPPSSNTGRSGYAADKKILNLNSLSQSLPSVRSSRDRRRSPDLQFLDRMRSEQERLNTYHDFPATVTQTPSSLAAAGLFYTGSRDVCQCAFCRGTLCNWEKGDDPLQEHRHHYTSCPFVNRRNVSNSPLHRASQQADVAAVSPTTRTHSSQNGRSNVAALGIQTERPMYPRYAVAGVREATFDHPAWSADCPLTPAMLAAAGFYYTGMSDQVQCFYCGGSLCNLEPAEDAWQPHARWLPRCPYVRMVKGVTFVQEMQRSLRSHNALTTTPSNENQGNLNMNSQLQGVMEYHIESREVKARMDTPMVRAVIAKGYSPAEVRRAIDHRLRSTGDDFPNARSLVEAILTMEESSAQNIQTKLPAKSTPRSNHGHTSLAAPLLAGGHHSSSDGRPDLQKMLEENEEMKEKRTCKVCLDNEVSMVFLPCAHLVCCATCTPALRSCPVCRALIRGTVRVYLS